MTIRGSYLPICDLLFGLVSLLLLHGTSLLLLLSAHSLHKSQKTTVYLIGAIPVTLLLSSVIANIISFIYYIKKSGKQEFDDEKRKRHINNNHDCLGLVLCLHIFQLGLIWRYLCLFKRQEWEVDKVRRKMREICILRQISSILYGLPCACILLYIQSKLLQVRQDAILLSTTTLVILDFSWALSCAGRREYMQRHDFTLCWPSILCQFVWRACTLSSRLLPLALFTSDYHYVTILVLLLHAIVIYFYLILFSPIVKEQSEHKFLTCANYLYTVVVLTFWYCSFDDANSATRYKRMVAYHILVLMENTLLTLLWIWNIQSQPVYPWYFFHVITVEWPLFAVGMLALLIFYKYLHITKLMKNHKLTNDFKTNKTSQEIRPNGAFQCQLPSVLRKKPSQFTISERIPSQIQTPKPEDTGEWTTPTPTRLSVRAVKSRKAMHNNTKPRSKSEDREQGKANQGTQRNNHNKSQENILMETIF